MDINPLLPVLAASPRALASRHSGAAGEPGAAGPGSAQAAVSEAEQRQLRELRARDREVRAHERAHAAAAGGLARGGPSFSTQRGPDGRMYAVGGEVQIDTGAIAGDPQATLRKAQQIQRAALAPAEPSAQDRAVAAGAAAMAAEARAEIARERSAAQHSSPATGDAEVQARAEADATGEPGASNQAAQACAVCGSRHGGGERAEQVAQHFAHSVTPRPGAGQRLSVIA